MNERWQSVLLRGLQTIERCHILRPAAKWYGITSPSLSFASLRLPLCSRFHSTFCPCFLGLARCWLCSADHSNAAHVWNNETASNAAALGTINVRKFLLSAILAFMTMRPLAPLQHCEQYTYIRIHNLYKLDFLNCIAKQDRCLRTSHTPPTENSLHRKISSLALRPLAINFNHARIYTLVKIQYFIQTDNLHAGLKMSLLCIYFSTYHFSVLTVWNGCIHNNVEGLADLISSEDSGLDCSLLPCFLIPGHMHMCSSSHDAN